MVWRNSRNVLLRSGLLGAALLWACLSWAGLVFGPGEQPPATALDRVVAVVNEDAITQRELDEAIARTGGSVPAPEVLNQLILFRLQRQMAEQVGVVVDNAAVTVAMEELAQRNGMSLEALRRTVQQDGMSFERFRARLQDQLIIARLRQQVVGEQVQVSDRDVTQVQDMTAGPAYRVAHVLVPVSPTATATQRAKARQTAQAIAASLQQDQDIQSYLDDIPGIRAIDLGWRPLDGLPTLLTPVVADLQPGAVAPVLASESGFHVVRLLDRRGVASDAHMAERYQVDHILIRGPAAGATAQEVQDRLARLRQDVMDQGGDFAALARLYSQDPLTVGKGGKMGWVSLNTLPGVFGRALTSVSRNQITEPFHTNLGWHIARWTDKKTVAVDQASQARAQARAEVFQQRAEEVWDVWLRQMRDQAYVVILDPALDQDPNVLYAAPLQ